MKVLKRLTHWHWIIILILTLWVVTKVRRAYLNDKNKNSLMNQNVKAFLKMIRFAEGTAGENGYRITFGYEKILTKLNDHPYITGEWKGKKLSDSMCKNAGQKSGCVSTAAGAYQITVSTWRVLKSRLNLPDFSPNSQDLAAIELIREKGALKDVEAGKIKEAITKVRKIWASLPGAGYSQPEKNIIALTAYYMKAGGTLNA